MQEEINKAIEMINNPNRFVYQNRPFFEFIQKNGYKIEYRYDRRRYFATPKNRPEIPQYYKNMAKEYTETMFNRIPYFGNEEVAKAKKRCAEIETIFDASIYKMREKKSSSQFCAEYR